MLGFKPALDEAVNYSGLIRDSRVIFTVDKKDFQLFSDKIAELTVKPDKEVEIRSDNTAEIPFDRKFAAEIKTVKDEMRLHDNLMELASVSAGNNDAQKEDLEPVSSEEEAEDILDADSSEEEEENSREKKMQGSPFGFGGFPNISFVNLADLQEGMAGRSRVKKKKKDH